MDRAILVYADLAGKPHPAGSLWARTRKGRETATFEYDRRWLANRDAFSLEPALSLGPGPHHTETGKGLFGAIGDSAPDRWGRLLMRRAERQKAAQEQRPARALGEIDYLLMVSDRARQGALRFAASERGPFLGSDTSASIPPLIELPRLLSATERIEGEDETAEDLRLLLAPGSSLGGARPKASVRDRDGSLAVAKFPQKGDPVGTVLWEAVALKLAAAAGVNVPAWRVEPVAERQVLLLRRFDREGALRVPFLSAMSMLGASDHENRSYLEIADAIRQYGAAPIEDLKQLWRRMAFNILISNTDDHLRNHAFLYTGNDGWRLSPAYDMNPVPADIKPRVLATRIDTEDATASLELAFGVAGHFALGVDEARKIAGETGRAVSRWRQTAARMGLRKAEIERMASAFDHKDLKNALKA